ncbi:hypothetical protein KCV03_g9972, partial [Aureobasidium melanogenum]
MPEIENYSFTINPIDWKVRDFGWLIRIWPMVFGCDIASVVMEVDSDVHQLNKGDRITGHTVSLVTNKAKNGSFQHLVAVEASKAARTPNSISFNEACMLLCFEQGYLGLKWLIREAGRNENKVVIYGASSSVGALATQLATVSNAYVVAITPC